jgi:hypothetical protein
MQLTDNEPALPAACARPAGARPTARFKKSSAHLLGCQLLPRSKVLKPEPSAAAMLATSALAADTLTRSAVVGDLIRSHRVPSVVSRIVPLRPTTQHTLFDTARPASKSDCTPLFCFCQLFLSVERKIIPEPSSAQ